MRRIFFLFSSIIIVSSMPTGSILAADAALTDEKDVIQTVITSDQLEFDYKRSISIFTGNVVVDDPSLKLTSDRLVVMFDATNQVRSLTASGNVHLISEDREGRCDRLVYLTLSGEIVMTGNAMITRGGDSVSGDLIKIWRDDERMEVKPGRLTIHGGTMPADLVPVPRPGGRQ